MNKLYLIDVSGYIFRSYFALPPMSNAEGMATHALYGFARSILKLLKDFSPTHLAACFDGPEGKKARKAIYTEYKAHRGAAPDDLPHQIEWASDLCALLGIPQVAVPGVEADDSMGAIAVKMAKKSAHVYLCTSDKDMFQIVGPKISILNTAKENLMIDSKGVEEKFGVRPDQIVDLLALMGDASDNIPGVSGIGAKTAAKLLQEYGTMENILAHAKEIGGKRGQTLVDEADQARLSHQLATLDLSVDVPAADSFYARQDPDEVGLRQFYQQMNFTTLLKELGVGKKEASVDYQIVDDLQSLAELIKTLEQAKEISFDTETSDLRPMQAELVGIGFCIAEGKAWYVPANGKLGLEKVLKELAPLFKKCQFYGHNVKYDLHVLANYGIDVKHLVFDTMLASYIINSHSRRHSLDHLALAHFDKVKTPIKEVIGKGTMLEVPIEKVGPYCCEDVDYTFRLKQLFADELKQRELGKVFYDMELPLVPILLKMERRGLYIDVPTLKKQAASLEKELTRLQEKIYQLAGGPFTINSPKQLSEILFTKMGIHPPKKTKTGFSTSADVLEQLAIEYPIAEEVLAYRSLDKLLSTYVSPLPDVVNPHTHRIHCTFNQSVAATGRLSCQDPNLQNIPVRSAEGRKIRTAFRPEKKGWVYLSADYSQIELRLLAHLSEDPALIVAFEKGEDIHAFTASQVLGIPIREITKDQRQHAKTVNFGILYGQQAFGLSRAMGVPIKDAALFIDAYFERFTRVREYIEECKQVARDTGRATTMFGRERAIPEITGRNAAQRTAAERLAVNTPLQGSAADLIKLAMLNIPSDLEMILQIHDELLFEVPENQSEKIGKQVKSIMEGVTKLKVPLIVDVAIGNNWKEC